MSKTPYLMGDSSMMMKSFKPKDHTRYKAKGFTFMASLFSFFICTSIFYLLNHSTNSTLTSLLNNNIFWFFMSNTLILFLAADYEAFASSSSHSCMTHQDHYEEYDKHSQATINYNHYVLTSKYEEDDEKPCVVVDVPPKQELLPEKEKEKKETVPNDHVSEFVPERVLEIVPQNDPKKPSPPPSSSKLEKPVQDDSNKNIKACVEKTLYPVGRVVGRSKSDRYGLVSKRVAIDEGRNRVIRRAETMKVAEARVEEENNDFSSMSNEELNRRVEEFIQRFNRQIRLQAVRNSIIHEA